MVVEQKVVSDSRESQSGFRAHLDNANLFDLIQIECTKNLKHVLKVVTEGRVAFLYISDRRVVHAECGDKSGIQVALEVLNWEGGSLREVEKPWPHHETIEISFQELMFQAVQYKDEQNKSDFNNNNSLVEKNNLLQFPESHQITEDDLVEKSGINVMEAFDMSTNQNGILANESVLSGAIADRESGEILSSKEDGEELSATAAFVSQLANLIGESFGMEEFKNLEAVSDAGKTFIISKENNIVGVNTSKSATLSSLEHIE